MIVGISLNSINAEVVEKSISGDISVNSTPVIESVEKRDVDVSEMKNVLAFKFSYETKYDPDVGRISMTGEVLYHTPKSEEIMKKWTKEKKIDEKIAVQILNAIFRKCVTKTVDLSNELGLPPPIRYPVVKPKDED